MNIHEIIRCLKAFLGFSGVLRVDERMLKRLKRPFEAPARGAHLKAAEGRRFRRGSSQSALGRGT